MTPPAARVEVTRDVYFGDTVEDPYRWLEARESDEARSWLDAQAAYARTFLDGLPERAEVRARISTLGGDSYVLSNVQLAGGRTFYLRRDPDAEVPRLVVRDEQDAAEQILLDPTALADDGPVAIVWYAPSHDGRMVAYGLARGGSMESSLHVLDVDSGRPLDLAISRASPSVMWVDDNCSFLYHRFAAIPAGAPPMERFRNNKTSLHRLGDDPARDQVIFARGLPGVAIDEIHIPLVHTAAGSEWLIGEVLHGILQRSLYAAQSRCFIEGMPCSWTQIAAVDDKISDFALAGDTLYLLTERDAPRRRVLALSLHDPILARATVLVPESRAIIEEIRVAGDYLLTRELDGGIARMRCVTRQTGAIHDVPLPIAGTIMAWTSETTRPEVVLHLTSWTTPPRLYRYDVDRGALAETAWCPVPPVTGDDLEGHEVHATSRDGTAIPLSIIHKKGLNLDGANPTLLQGYGSHGIALTPAFSAPMRAWYERGGVLAVAHVRGGGEYGAAWHEAGRAPRKQDGIDDFIACAEYLIEQGYARPAYLAAEGRSAGGLLIGNALVQRPDLWAAIILEVPVTNPLRFETTESGVGNVGEFGSVETEEGFRGLYRMDAYTHVRDGVAYPAVLLTTGEQDPSTVGQAAKMAARLQAASISGWPVLLRIEAQGGHGQGTAEQEEERLADKLAFLMHHLHSAIEA